MIRGYNPHTTERVGDKMRKDITGTPIIPGNGGRDCPGNGLHRDEQGNIIECCCDECDHLMCCVGWEDSSTSEKGKRPYR